MSNDDQTGDRYRSIGKAAVRASLSEEEVERFISIGMEIERAAKELPPGFELTITIEKDAGTVSLTDSEGNQFDVEGGDTFGHTISRGIDQAITRSQQ